MNEKGGTELDINDVKQAIAKNDESFLKCMKAVQDSLYRISIAIVKNEHDCHDAIQETILKAYRSIEKLKEPSHFKTWMIRILINESNDILRKRKKLLFFQKVKEEGYTPTYCRNEELHKALESLPNKQKMIVLLFYFEELRVEEIAEVLQVSSGTVKQHLFRARKALGKILKKDREGEVYYEGV